jgi:hypothetical protein
LGSGGGMPRGVDDVVGAVGLRAAGGAGGGCAAGAAAAGADGGGGGGVAAVAGVVVSGGFSIVTSMGGGGALSVNLSGEISHRASATVTCSSTAMPAAGGDMCSNRR